MASTSSSSSNQTSLPTSSSSSSVPWEIENWKLILAIDSLFGIGYQGKMPWPRLPQDTRHFRETTTTTKDPKERNAVIMGRRTWESFSSQGPLPKRLNIILSSSLSLSSSPSSPSLKEGEDLQICRSFDEAVELLKKLGDQIEKVFVIGGVEVYKEALRRGASTIWLTSIQNVFACDRYMPADFLDGFRLKSSSEKHFVEHLSKDSGCFLYFTISKLIKKKKTQ